MKIFERVATVSCSPTTPVPSPAGRVRNGYEKNLGSKQGSRGVREIAWETMRVPVDSIPKERTWLPDRALTSGAQNCDPEGAM